MGRKLNPAYRERMAERRRLPVCRVCKKRSRTGTHKTCWRDYEHGQRIGVSWRAVRRLRQIYKAGELPYFEDYGDDDVLVAAGYVDIVADELFYQPGRYISCVILTERGIAALREHAPD